MQNRNIFLAVGIGLGVGLLLTRRKAGAEAGKYFDFEKQVYVTPQDAIAESGRGLQHGVVAGSLRGQSPR